MSETKFTPGPWKKSGLSITTSNGTICTAPLPQSGGCFSIQDNLELIAAAPEMYEALNNLFQSYTSDKSEVFHERLSDLMFHAGNALAKAGRA